jgi:hypothetical protein
MRLIDADELLKILQEQQKLGNVNDSRGRAKAILEVIHAPTVEAEPVKHGTWKLYAKRRDSDGYIVNNFVCSNCDNMITSVPEGLAPDIVSPYCAKCGARMDGDAK